MNRLEFYLKLSEFKGEKTSNYLQHYGTLGQKWGVRKWQNYDGTFNEAGKERYFGRSKQNGITEIKNNNIKEINRTSDKVNEIVNTLNKDERDKLCMGEDEEYLSPDQAEHVIYRALKENNGVPVAFFDLLKDDNGDLSLAFATRSEPNNRNKGYASEVTKEAMNWLEENKDNLPFDKAVWGVRVDNIPSIKIAEKNGFEIDENSYSDDGRWVNYVKKLKEDQKIGSFFNKTPEEKEFKEAKRLAQELNFDNGTRVLKELRNSEYGKKHIQPIYNEYEENMNKLGDRVEKIIKDNPVDEIEAGIANALFKSGTNKTSITDIIESVRKQHHSSSFDEPINTERLPLLKSDEDLWTDMINYKKDFGNKIEKELKNIYPKAKTSLSYYIALSDYENDKLEKVYSMNGEEYRKYQLYHLMDGLVPEVNKKMIKKDVIEPTNKLYLKVEKIINNTNAGDPSYNWTDINNALSKLGLDSKPADELTNADWKKIYEICSQ